MSCKLITGEVYFLVAFYDSHFRFPKIDTLVYLGTEVDIDGDSGRVNWHCFQDASSFVKYGRFDRVDASIDVADDIEVKSFSGEDVLLIDDLAGVIRKLENCLSNL